MLEEAVGELRGEMDRRVNEWKDEAQRLKEAWKAEIVQNKGIVLSTLHAMKDVTTPQAKEMGEKRSLSKLVTLITDKALGLQYNLELSRKELSSTHDALWKLRDQMEAMAKESRDALEQVEKAHTSERSSLVTSAISSLQHLRSHLTEQALKQSGAQTERRPWIHLEKLNTPSPPTMARSSKPSPVKLRASTTQSCRPFRWWCRFVSRRHPMTSNRRRRIGPTRRPIATGHRSSRRRTPGSTIAAPPRRR